MSASTVGSWRSGPGPIERRRTAPAAQRTGRHPPPQKLGLGSAAWTQGQHRRACQTDRWRGPLSGPRFDQMTTTSGIPVLRTPGTRTPRAATSARSHTPSPRPPSRLASLTLLVIPRRALLRARRHAAHTVRQARPRLHPAVPAPDGAEGDQTRWPARRQSSLRMFICVRR